ncbi:hypothetical protein B0H14DRAFT_3618646 [Mycena olivaceomarginata]|nr:hypothetical protein B0H14DRAFT_3618646 [Mycena olivaceomarginata]
MTCHGLVEQLRLRMLLHSATSVVHDICIAYGDAVIPVPIRRIEFHPDVENQAFQGILLGAELINVRGDKFPPRTQWASGPAISVTRINSQRHTLFERLRKSHLSHLMAFFDVRHIWLKWFHELRSRSSFQAYHEADGASNLPTNRKIKHFGMKLKPFEPFKPYGAHIKQAIKWLEWLLHKQANCPFELPEEDSDVIAWLTCNRSGTILIHDVAQTCISAIGSDLRQIPIQLRVSYGISQATATSYACHVNNPSRQILARDWKHQRSTWAERKIQCVKHGCFCAKNFGGILMLQRLKKLSRDLESRLDGGLTWTRLGLMSQSRLKLTSSRPQGVFYETRSHFGNPSRSGDSAQLDSNRLQSRLPSRRVAKSPATLIERKRDLIRNCLEEGLQDWEFRELRTVGGSRGIFAMFRNENLVPEANTVASNILEASQGGPGGHARIPGMEIQKAEAGGTGVEQVKAAAILKDRVDEDVAWEEHAHHGKSPG